jgi:hypothetical protein
MALPGRTFSAATAVVFGLALFAILMSIYSIAAFHTQTAANLHVPVLEAGDEEPMADQTKDDDTPTPTLMPTSDEFLPSGDTEPYVNPGADEAKEAAFAGRFAEGAKKPDEVDRRDGLSGGLSNKPADRPAYSPVLPTVEPPSIYSLPSENPTAATPDPAQIPVPPYYDETLQPPPLETTLPDSPTVSESPYLQPLSDLPPDLPPDVETPPQPTSDLPADAGQFPPPPPETLGSPQGS